MSTSPFSDIAEDRILLRDDLCMAFYDTYPVTEGHVLIVPHRTIASFREMSDEEWLSVLDLARRISGQLRAEDPSIEGFNLGINDGEVAGQTVFHAHIHLIPRRKGDVPNPRGGVRWIFPDKADYTGQR
ncbi:MAG: HIT family protein [Verrucomicrobia bacterium]|nr:HIT family protein [Verrucomicrobiota bacterium]